MQTYSNITNKNGVLFVVVRHWNYPVSFYYAKGGDLYECCYLY